MADWRSRSKKAGSSGSIEPDIRPRGLDRSGLLLRDHQIDLAVVEGLRLDIAFKKTKDPCDRRLLMELAERLARD